MRNAIIEAINARFNEDGVAKITMKDAAETVVTIIKNDWTEYGDGINYDVVWGFNNSYGKRFLDSMEEVAEVIEHFEEVRDCDCRSKAKLLDMIMELQLMEEGTKEATADEISELRSEISDWSKDFYSFRYRGHCEKRQWF